MAETPFWPAFNGYFDDNGEPLVGGKIYSYDVGTSDEKDTYPTADDAAAETNANTNPVILDAGGRAAVWLRNKHKIIVKTAADVEVQTIDDVGSTDQSDALPLGYVSGLALTLATDADHDVTFAAGTARDAADSEDIVLASAITKQIDAVWAEGTNAGGLDTGTVANSTRYYLWLIANTSDGVTDALFSLSSSSPTMPASYDKKVLVGAGQTDASGNWENIGPANRNLPLDADGRAGLGTAPTTSKLTVQSDSTSAPALTVKGDGAAVVLDTVTATDARIELKRNGTREGVLAWNTDTVSLDADGATGVVKLRTNNADRVTVGPGVQIGSPTGGDKGAGTLNAVQLWEANNRVLSENTSEASAAEMEAASNSTHYVSPRRVFNSPWVAKAWVHFNMSTGAIAADQGVSSVTDNGVGDFDVNWDTAFNGAYCPIVSGNYLGNGSTVCFPAIEATSASNVQVVAQPSGGAGGRVDVTIVTVVAFGDQ